MSFCETGKRIQPPPLFLYCSAGANWNVLSQKAMNFWSVNKPIMTAIQTAVCGSQTPAVTERLKSNRVASIICFHLWNNFTIFIDKLSINTKTAGTVLLR